MLRKVFLHSGPIHSKVDGVSFSLYSTEEIRKLSVVKVTTPLAFNALGHPLPGGLYDLAMGINSLNVCFYIRNFKRMHFQISVNLYFQAHMIEVPCVLPVNNSIFIVRVILEELSYPCQ